MKYPLSEEQIYAYCRGRRSPFVFLETAAFNHENGLSYLFKDFERIITFCHGDDLQSFFNTLQRFLQKGYWLTGYFAYEFGYYLEPALKKLRKPSVSPLAWIGVCKRPLAIGHVGKEFEQKKFGAKASRIENVKPSVSLKQYRKGIKKIKNHLEAGLTYQVNYTFKVKFRLRGSPLDLYTSLRRTQPTAYSALINTGREHILSHSPELFFRIDKEKVIARPMKGTIERGATQAGDKSAQKSLKQSKKTKAENIMIVDLLRNDLGRIAKKVWVPALFEIERHKTLHQMTSTVHAKLKDRIKVEDFFKALFPCGSVTGAPKIKTMEIIHELEKEPRRVYTGAIGFLSPQGQACFNVAIRTIYLDRNKKGELGVGGGIVYDSVDEDEYNEALLKAQFFVGSPPCFQLIETIRYSKQDGFYLLGLHLRRLKNSCKYFSIPFRGAAIKNKLKAAVANTKGQKKVRLLLDSCGDAVFEVTPLLKAASAQKAVVSEALLNPKDQFLYHKTTQRKLYNKEVKRAKEKGFFEVLFFNIQGQLCEGSFTNVFIEKNKKLFTPPLRCGLLPGVLREHLLQEGIAREKALGRDDLLGADRVYVGNSVRGLMKVKVVGGRRQRKKL